MPQEDEVDYSQPVAYDRDGRPLYAHPPKADGKQDQAYQQAVHLARAAEPVMPKLSDETIRRHEESVARYPTLNLTEGEYVVAEVRRHPIGLFVPVAGAGLLVLLIIAGLVGYPMLVPNGNPPFDAVLLPALLFVLLIGLGTYIVSRTYWNNEFFLTNESIIQETQHSLFGRHEQTVSLANVEDVSYAKRSIAQHLFDYGSIRLSTEGEETTYQFNYVANPKKQTEILHNAVEAFKNGRPISG